MSDFILDTDPLIPTGVPADPVQVGILVIEDVLPADPVQVGILVIEDVLPAESIPALAEAGLDVVLPE